MREHSIYEVHCPKCEAVFECADKEASCPKCGLRMRIEWGGGIGAKAKTAKA